MTIFSWQKLKILYLLPPEELNIIFLGLYSCATLDTSLQKLNFIKRKLLCLSIEQQIAIQLAKTRKISWWYMCLIVIDS